VNTREIASEYRLAKWSQAIQEKTANGESVGEFCQNRRISHNTYFYWQRKLREMAAKQMAQGSPGSIETMVPSGWAVCKEAEKAAPENSVSIEIGKCRVTVGAGASSEQLAKVCKVLMSIC